MIRCLIVDDEPAARDILQTYISDTDEIELAGICKDALEARKELQSSNIDLLFLDINMPRLSGIDLIKSLQQPPKVILTTAYSEYALEGYELDVVDYLLKPFSFERFLKAVDKAQQMYASPQEESRFITVKADGKLYRIHFNDILFAESQGDYITLHTKDQKLTFYETLKNFYGQLPKTNFARVHRSFIVSLANIDYVEGNMIRLGSQEIPIGKAYKENFTKKYLA